MAALVGLAGSTAALADDDAKIEARIGTWGRACKNEVAVKYPKSNMSEISVEVGATLKQSIDAGETTLKDIKKNGLSFNWQFKKHTGYCNTDGNGNVTEFVKFQ
ncbi:hypothetical protein [Cyanobium usitatum]|uniref:hypothetical protein n=1 Tax=Cyanobium usitatum TaxID=2304190 RepID=UPI002AD43B7B|nr:hypothetical protein [Cyanobium usitatum]